MTHLDKEIRHLLGKAIHTREMIQNGDRVMVAVSGGLDSLSLLWLLRERLKRIPVSYTLTAVHVDLGFGANSGDRMDSFFSQHGFDYRIIKTDIGEKATALKTEKAPAFYVPGSGGKSFSRQLRKWDAGKSRTAIIKMM